MENRGIGTDVVSILKAVNRLSELALKDVEDYRDTHDLNRIHSAANYLREMEEFIGGYKLPFIIAAFEHFNPHIDAT